MFNKINKDEIDGFFKEVLSNHFNVKIKNKNALFFTSLPTNLQLEYVHFEEKPLFIHVGYTNFFNEIYSFIMTNESDWNYVVPIMHKRIGTWNIKYKN